MYDFGAKTLSMFYGQTITSVNPDFNLAGGKYTFTLGGAYKFNDMIAVGYSIRYVTAFIFAEGSTSFVNEETGQSVLRLDLDRSQEGSGIGHTFSVLVNLGEKPADWKGQGQP